MINNFFTENGRNGPLEFANKKRLVAETRLLQTMNGVAGVSPRNILIN